MNTFKAEESGVLNRDISFVARKRLRMDNNYFVFCLTKMYFVNFEKQLHDNILFDKSELNVSKSVTIGPKYNPAFCCRKRNF
jgi:hypothetical protein